MKQLKYFFFLPASIILLAISCSKTDTVNAEESGNWITRSQLSGDARYEAVSFVVADTAYIGTGVNLNFSINRYQDFWAYNPTTNGWTAKANFGGVGRNSAAAFTVGTKGYVTTGYSGTVRLKDTWEYNPATNTWAKMTDFPEPPSASTGNSDGRFDATGFAIGSLGYIVCGYTGASAQKDFYQFNPSLGTGGTWTVKTSAFPGLKRSGAISWVYNNEAYILTGVNNGTNVNDFYKYTPLTDTWIALRSIANISTDSYDDDYTDIVRNNAVGFVLGSKGYLCLGENGSYTKKTWEYDFVTDLWVRKTPFERAERTGALGFTVKGRAFVTTGRNSTYYFDDLEEFLPNQTYNSVD